MFTHALKGITRFHEIFHLLFTEDIQTSFLLKLQLSLRMHVRYERKMDTPIIHSL